MKLEKGFTLVEVALVVSLFLILVGIATVNLFQFQHKSQLPATVNSFIADYKEQQIKAMVGDTEGSSAVSNYGIHFDTTSYTLFRNTYGTGNFAISLPSSIQVSTTFSNSQVVFQKGTGELGGTGTITFLDAANGGQTRLTINKLGVITAIN
jgi:prepilin-type N-terminal cleavage/methylation domain-containing protein